MQISNVAQKYIIYPQNTAPKKAQEQTQQQPQTQQELPYNPMVSKYIIKQTSQILPTQKIQPINNNANVQNVQWNNHFRDMLRNNEAIILGVVPRTMNAKDLDGNGLIQEGEISGNFINAIDRLDEIKDMGINTLHILPIHPTGKTLAMGIAGSLYAPDKFIEDDGKLAVDPNLKDPNTPGTAWDHFKIFIDECHKRGISVMLDLPSCASLDFAKRHPELMAKEKDGQDKTPQGWQDIRMFRVWDDEGKRILNPKLVDMHKKYVDACVELGIDGIRADVSRAKPIEFWNVLIPYSHTLDSQFGWLAESYTHEDASPQLNMPYDRPEDQLRGGFNSYYGQFHILSQWTKADDIFNYMKENIDMSNRLNEPKSLIGSMTTHDDQSPMYQGGAPWVMFTTVLQNTLPMVNPYYIDGVQTGDYYLYPYDHAKVANSQTDNNECTVHTGRLDIFNNSRRPGGDFPEIQDLIKQTHSMRNKYKDINQYGSLIKLETNNPEVIAYARHKDGKTLLVVANRNANLRRSAKIQIPGFKVDQELKNLVPSYAQPSYFQKSPNTLTVDLGPLRAHVFEINTPEIEYYSKPENVMKQNFENYLKPRDKSEENLGQSAAYTDNICKK